MLHRLIPLNAKILLRNTCVLDDYSEIFKGEVN